MSTHAGVSEDKPPKAHNLHKPPFVKRFFSLFLLTNQQLKIVGWSFILPLFIVFALAYKAAVEDGLHATKSHTWVRGCYYLLTNYAESRKPTTLSCFITAASFDYWGLQPSHLPVNYCYA